MQQLYPFPAVVGGDPDAPGGLDDMALALVLCAIDPAIGGVLVRGEKGTAKSTLVRALAHVLPHIDVVAGDRFSTDPADPQPLSPDGPFADDAAVETRPVRLVELPVGATEDRVAGSIHLERALRDGAVAFEPGLLARAHRGILYVDEVNLLHDHLVDLLLDAAAMGRLTVERDNVSVTHAARFVLVGTMNPEEGELRPQLLDRFGLTVEVAAPRDPAQRAEVVRRRLAFDADPVAFRAAWADAEDRLRARITAAQEALPAVEITAAALLKVAELCAAFGVDGMRADIVTARTAAAHAAWQGRTDITVTDLRVAAKLALPHRRRRNPFDTPGLDDAELDDMLPPDDPDGGGDGGPGDGPDDDPDPPGGRLAGRMQQVKTAILSLLLDAYRRRDRVALVTFRDRGADLALPATRSVDVAARRLDDLPAGGRTPLAEGLVEAAEVVRRERLRDPSRRPLLVVVTDGRATAGTDAVARSRRAADHLRQQGVSGVVVDCESGRMRMGLAQRLATHLGADHVPLARVDARALTDIVRDATRGAA
ncbi:magnesium chelatase [Mycolicibacterium grossiae]|uniref:Mg-protoporphyrin IX chelatase n=1 Tax=Mycolicibacterium grossiae TaxID=1552759 RepID=A0A1E8Q0G2_9MYCO|nr:AAA family ATPase [Mycolicibacterium grossiae]OFJ51530.1 magnesium chelatase [Mycolicibacterium grossiae]